MRQEEGRVSDAILSLDLLTLGPVIKLLITISWKRRRMRRWLRGMAEVKQQEEIDPRPIKRQVYVDRVIILSPICTFGASYNIRGKHIRWCTTIVDLQ